MKTFMYFVTGTAIGAKLFVALGLPFQANVIWVFTDAYLVYHNHKIKEYAQAILFLIYGIISAFGIYYLW